MGKNHKPKIQMMTSAGRAHEILSMKQTMPINAARPYTTKMDFINVERGSIPTALTTVPIGQRCHHCLASCNRL